MKYPSEYVVKMYDGGSVEIIAHRYSKVKYNTNDILYFKGEEVIGILTSDGKLVSGLSIYELEALIFPDKKIWVEAG